MSIRDNATAYAVGKALSDALSSLLDRAKPELVRRAVDELGHGSIEARIGDTVLGKVSIAGGKPKAVTVDSHAYREWVATTHPAAIIDSVDPAFTKRLIIRDGCVYDPATGELVPGMEVGEGATYPSVRFAPGGREAALEAITSGALSLPDMEARMLPAGDES